MEGVYRALSVAVGTHIFRRVETPMLIADKVTTWHQYTCSGFWVEVRTPEESKLMNRNSLHFFIVFS